PAAFGHGVTRRDHQVVATQVQALDRGGKERQIVAVIAVRKPVEKAGGDAMALDDRAGGAGNVHEGEDVRVRVQQAKLLEDALAAAEPGEPVVDEGDLHRAASR